MARALREEPLDLRTTHELCPTRARSTAEDTDTPSPPPENLALARALLAQLCEVSAEAPMFCAAARQPLYDDLVENTASFVMLGAFTKTRAKQALLSVGPHSVLFEWVGREFAPRAVMPALDLEFAQCLVVAPPAHVQQVACFQRIMPGISGSRPKTVLDVYDFEAMRTTRLFAFSDTFLTSCGNVDNDRLLDLFPAEISAANQRVAPDSLALRASFLVATKPKAYDRSCLDLLQRNFEMGAPVGDTAALLCSMPEYTEAKLEFAFEDGAWQPASATEELLDRLEVEGPWYRALEVRATTSPRAARASR